MSAGSIRRAATARRTFTQLIERQQVDQARCIGCGCTDIQGCPEGCYWVEVNRRTGEGVCSGCSDQVSTGARRQ